MLVPTNLNRFSVLPFPLVADNLIPDKGRTLLLELLGLVVFPESEVVGVAFMQVAGGADVEKLLPAEEEKEAFLGIYIVVAR